MIALDSFPYTFLQLIYFLLWALLVVDYAVTDVDVSEAGPFLSKEVKGSIELFLTSLACVNNFDVSEKWKLPIGQDLVIRR